jgi:hypothetical protein
MEKKRAIEFNDSLYVYKFQLDLFLNDRNFNVNKKTLKYSNSFDDYCTNCACFNLLTDLTKEYPDDIDFFWSEEYETFGFIFLSESKIGDRLIELNILTDLKEKFCEVLFQ